MSGALGNIEHPTVSDRGRISGSGTAGATASLLQAAEHYVIEGVWIHNEDAAEGLRVIMNGSATGILLPAGLDRFFPCSLLHEITVQRAGTVDLAYSWTAH